MLIYHPDTIAAPFFMLAPEFLRLPLVVLAAMATVIASQAVISGALAMTHQAMQLGFLPRFRIIHTSEHERGKVYISFINLLMMFLIMCLVVIFKHSSNLGAAYGIAVTGTMVIDSLLLAIVIAVIGIFLNAYVVPAHAQEDPVYGHRSARSHQTISIDNLNAIWTSPTGHFQRYLHRHPAYPEHLRYH